MTEREPSAFLTAMLVLIILWLVCLNVVVGSLNAAGVDVRGLLFP